MVERLKLNPKPPEPIRKKRGRFVYKSRERIDEERRVNLIKALLADMRTADGIAFLYGSLLVKTITASSNWIAEQVEADIEAFEIVPAWDAWEEFEDDPIDNSQKTKSKRGGFVYCERTDGTARRARQRDHILNGRIERQRSK